MQESIVLSCFDSFFAEDGAVEAAPKQTRGRGRGNAPRGGASRGAPAAAARGNGRGRGRGRGRGGRGRGGQTAANSAPATQEQLDQELEEHARGDESELCVIMSLIVADRQPWVPG